MLSIILRLNKEAVIASLPFYPPLLQNFSTESCDATVKLNFALSVLVYLLEDAGPSSLSGAEDSFPLW